MQSTFKARILPFFSLISLGILGALIGYLIFQQFYNEYYNTSISISIVVVSYGTSATFMIWLSSLFISWYRSSRSLIVLLYFVAMSVIAFNLVMTAAFTSAKIGDRPDRVGEYVGSSGDISGSSHAVLNTIYRISSFVAFFGIWITTVILMKSYREKLISPILFWIILIITPCLFFDYVFIPDSLRPVANLLRPN